MLVPALGGTASPSSRLFVRNALAEDACEQRVLRLGSEGDQSCWEMLLLRVLPSLSQQVQGRLRKGFAHAGKMRNIFRIKVFGKFNLDF